MGVAAYNRGTALVRRQMQEEFDRCQKRRDLEYAQQLCNDAERLAAGVKEMAERKHYFSMCGWHREARAALARGREYRRKFNRATGRLRRMGFDVSTLLRLTWPD